VCKYLSPSPVAAVASGREAGEALREAEVGQLERAAVPGEGEVGGLEIAVHDDGVEGVEVMECGEDVEGPFVCLVLKKKSANC
jgi:hypothetical protein